MNAFMLWMMGVFTIASLVGCGSNACDDLKSACEACTEPVSRSVCMSIIEADDEEACEQVHQNGLQVCAAGDAGFDTGF